MAQETRRKARVTLPRDDQILITRDFAAPRDRVFRAYTTPELVALWWHADRGTIDSIEIDLRVGGRWRYAMTANGGFRVVFHGQYLEIVTAERIVSTEVFEGMPEAAATSTVTFTDSPAGTTLAILVQHKNQANRDAHMRSGMEDGLQAAMDHLEEVATSKPMGVG
ncbi:MAG TPA: SRPBCC family protein [Candidatus Dormibacteraeota bacterium]|nr:SRPBCC family protein [Candidatus Dormibacteraeota bacterium]